METKLLSIIIGILGALIGVYFRESLRTAKLQKITAVKLEAYLKDIVRDIIDTDFINFYIIGKQWENELAEALLRGGENEFAKINKKYEETLEEIRNLIETGSDEVVKSIKSQHNLYRKMNQAIFDHLKKQLEITGENLFKNIGFISDEDAAVMPWPVVHHVVEFRNHAQKIISKSISLMLILRNMDDFDYNAISSLLYEIIKSSILLSRKISPLETFSLAIRKKSLLRLAVNNMIGKA